MFPGNPLLKLQVYKYYVLRGTTTFLHFIITSVTMLSPCKGAFIVSFFTLMFSVPFTPTIGLTDCSPCTDQFMVLMLNLNYAVTAFSHF